MTDKKLKERIRDSFNGIAPDMSVSLLSDIERQKGQITTMQKNAQKKNKKPILKTVIGIAAALVLVCAGILGISIYSNNAVVSEITLDVNPSIGIELNKGEKVLAVSALNEDARKVIGDMDFRGSTLDVTMNAIIGSMLRNGYINDASNSILVSVNSKDEKSGATMQQKLMNDISSILESGNVTGAVLAQTVSESDELKTLAEKYGITPGKAKLIQQIVKQNSFYKFEDLISLTINELNLISESGPTKLDGIDSIGTASSSAYLSDKEVKDIAFAHAGVTVQQARQIKIEMDWEDGIMVYEVDFIANGTDYEYEINALTGDIVSVEKEIADNPAQSEKSNKNKQNDSKGSPYVGKDVAKKNVLEHAGLTENDISKYSCELDREHGIKVYEIEFDAKGYEYDYYVNAESGEIVRYQKEADDDAHEKSSSAENPKSKSSASKKEYIGESAAKKAALTHTGLSAGEIHNYECEFEEEGGKVFYEVSFDVNGYEYEYDIDALTGKIIKFSKEKDD